MNYLTYFSFLTKMLLLAVLQFNRNVTPTSLICFGAEHMFVQSLPLLKVLYIE